MILYIDILNDMHRGHFQVQYLQWALDMFGYDQFSQRKNSSWSIVLYIKTFQPPIWFDTPSPTAGCSPAACQHRSPPCSGFLGGTKRLPWKQQVAQNSLEFWNLWNLQQSIRTWFAWCCWLPCDCLDSVQPKWWNKGMLIDQICDKKEVELTWKAPCSIIECTKVSKQEHTWLRTS